MNTNHHIRTSNLCTNTKNVNDYGEKPIDHAPTIVLSNNHNAVPQQFLSTNHTRSTLEAIVLKIDTPEGFLLFVGERNEELFLQVGVIGCENYPKNQSNTEVKDSESARKIVYGRRWLIERTSPTSEVIQTANLAVKKAREHELREKIFVTTASGRVATPFNCHLDLPLMAANKELFAGRSATDNQTLESIVSRFRVSELLMTSKAEPILLDDGILLTIELTLPDGSEERHFPELEGQRLRLFVEEIDTAAIMHALIEQLLNKSEHYVDEHFSFDDFKRFNRSINPLDVAEFSIATRSIGQNSDCLIKSHADFSYEIDAKRVPPFSAGALGARQRRRLLSERNLCGHLPNQG